MYSLEELFSEIGVHDPEDVSFEDINSLGSLDSIYAEAKNVLIKNDQNPLVTKAAVQRIVASRENVIAGKPDQFSSAIFKALLSKAFK